MRTRHGSVSTFAEKQDFLKISHWEIAGGVYFSIIGYSVVVVPAVVVMAFAAFFFGLALGHGSLVVPPSRNNYQQKDPANTTGSSHIDQGPCVGGACLWFSEGSCVLPPLSLSLSPLALSLFLRHSLQHSACVRVTKTVWILTSTHARAPARPLCTS